MTLPIPEHEKASYIQIGPFADDELCRKCVERINDLITDDANVVISRVILGLIYNKVPVQLRDDRMRIYPEMSKILLLNEMKRLSEEAESVSLCCDDRIKISEQICKIGEIVNDKNR